MGVVVEELYCSANGDRWALVRDPATQALWVRHTANASSGGNVHDMAVDAFLAIDGPGPEFAAVRAHLGPAAPGVALAVATAVQAAWEAAFAARDAGALAALYAPQTTFYGSTDALHTDPAGVRGYFAALGESFLRACFATPHIVELGPDAFVAAGPVVFTISTGGRESEHPYRMTWVFARQPGGWLIASHHASPRPV